MNELISRVIRAHQKFLSLDQTPLLKAAQVIHDAFIRDNKVLLFGNGGSASDAQHVAAEFVGRFMRDRNALPAIALTADTSVMTAVANDYGYEYVFARQIEALGRSGDVVIGISTSGNSKNVVNAYKKAHKLKFRDIFTFTGFNKNSSLSRISKNNIWIDSKNYNQVENLHQICLLSIVDLFKKYKK